MHSYQIPITGGALTFSEIRGNRAVNPALFFLFFFLHRLRTLPTKYKGLFAKLGLYGKVDFIKGYWNPERKLGLAMHFSEIEKNAGVNIFLKRLDYTFHHRFP